MALQIVTGDLSVNKKAPLIQELFKIKAQDPQAIIYYLVPEHIKFDMETFVLKESQKMSGRQESAMMDIQVVSFTRLAWFMLDEKQHQRTNLSDIGLTMVIKQLLDQYQDQLIVYKGQQHHLGFVEKLLALFEELYQGNVNPEALTDDMVSKQVVEATILNMEAQRIKELQLLYTAFIDTIETQSLANYQTYLDLSHYLAQHEAFDHHYLVVDHHYFFNAQQYQLLVDLAQKFKRVWLTLPIKQSQINSAEWLPMVQIVKDTYRQLKHYGQLFNFEVLPDWEIQAHYFNYQPAILEVASRFQQQQSQLLVPQALNSATTHHYFWQFETVQSELRHISNQIHYLVTIEGYRYRDILVLTRDMDLYQQMLGPIFEMNQIPYFFDHEANMSQHPLVLWLEAVLNLSLNHWRYQDLMLVIKSDLLMPEWLEGNIEEARHQKALLENILIANGYFGFRFYSEKFEWQFPQSEQPYVNYQGDETNETIFEGVSRWRQWLVSNLYQPLSRWDKGLSGQQAGEWLYQLLVDTQVQKRLMALRDQAIERGQIELSRRFEQVWQVLMDALDEFHQLYGEKNLSLALFAELLLTGLQQATYHIIPPTMDQVTVTSIESPQVQPAKICFILGADDHSLPKTYTSDSLLTEDNRAAIQERLLPHQNLADTANQRNQMEQLIGYQLLLDGTDQLYFSVALSVGESQRQFSPYILNLIKSCQFKVESFGSEHHPFLNEQIHSNQLGRLPMQLSPLLGVLRHQYQNSLPMTHQQKQLLHQVLYAPEAIEKNWQQLVHQIFKFNVLPKALTPETAIALFGQNISASVSKIEAYYQDPFSHFLTYGLRLKEREQYEIDAAKTGDYFHHALDLVMAKIIASGRTLVNLTAEELRVILNESIEAINQEWKFNIFSGHPRMQAIKLQLDQQLWRFLQFSYQQQAKIKMRTLKTEAIFGMNPQHDLKGMSYPLSSGGKLYITGKIDRIDELVGANKLQIIDYKSGKKQFKLEDAYYGHDLQILTYLNIALQNYPKFEALGAFYQPLIHNFNEVTPDVLAQASQGTLYDTQLKNNLLHGFVAADEADLMQIDPDIEEQSDSLIYPVSLKKDGQYKASSKVIRGEDLQLVLRMTDERFIQAAEEMQSGRIDLAPYKDNPYTTTLQPGYRVISGFDATEHYHLYRRKTIKAKEVMNQLKIDFEGKEEG